MPKLSPPPWLRRSRLSPLLALALFETQSCGNGSTPDDEGAGRESPGMGGMTTAAAGGGNPGAGGSANGGAAPAQGGEASPGGGSAGTPSAGATNGGTPEAGGSNGGPPGAGAPSGGTPEAGTGGSSAAGKASGSAGKASTGGSGAMPTFSTKTLASTHTAEGADVGDIDGDGMLDLVAGPTWYKGPAFAVGGTLVNPVPTYTRDQYSKFFLTFVDNLDSDTYPDVIGIGDAGGANGTGTPNAYWYKNPGPAALDTAWARSPIIGGLVANESPIYANLVGTARKELIFMTEQKLGYAEPGATATDPWTFNAISGTATFGTPYVHGLGVGDLNGDGKADIVERSGWWEQPAAAGGTWTKHTVDFGVGLSGTRPGNWGGAQMAIFDVDGDGDSDVVTALAAHAYGLSWFEQVSADSFTPHVILPASATGMSFSQQHALTVADINGDGLLDVVTGKRYYAHPSSNADPGSADPPVLYWFELKREGGVTFSPHVIHDDSGAGCNFPIGDFNGDGKLDVFTTNKRGTFLHTRD